MHDALRDWELYCVSGLGDAARELRAGGYRVGLLMRARALHRTSDLDGFLRALLIGLLDVREIKRNTTTAAAAFRYGVGHRLEVEAKIPYVYRTDSTVSREIFTGTAAERAGRDQGGRRDRIQSRHGARPERQGVPEHRLRPQRRRPHAPERPGDPGLRAHPVGHAADRRIVPARTPAGAPPPPEGCLRG
jgi:hypothetical protein